MSSKRVLLIIPAMLVVAALIYGLGRAFVWRAQPTPQVVEKAVELIVRETVIVEKEVPVEKVVKETVVVEKEVAAEKVVMVTVVVERAVAVEKVVTATPAGAPTPADMFFQNYGINPFVDTEQDHLATFALDVDTGSYTLARSYVSDGNLPPQDGVRVEEFVNYFRQGYAYPPKGRAFAIHIDGAPFPFAETERNYMLRVGIQGYAVPPDERKDVALTFVIDTSGSMADGGRLELVKQSLESLVAQLRASDSVSIVEYGSSAYPVLEPTSGALQPLILGAIRSLSAGGSTNAEAGLRLGYQQANAAFKSEAINRVILCSDGVANVGATGPDSILAAIERDAAKGITLTSVGVGMGNYNDVLLEQLADKGNGRYVYIDTAKEAERLFVDNLAGTLQAIALDAKVQVDFNPEVVARYRLLGFENRAISDEQFRSAKVKAAEIGAGHSVTALFEVELRPDASGQIATVYLRWTDPDNKEIIEIKQPFASEALAADFTESAPRLQWDTIVAEYAEILRGSPFAQNSSLAAVLEEAQRVAPLLADDRDVQELVDIVRRANALSH